MDLSIKKDKRSKGKYVHRTGGIKGIYKTKKQAMKDIVEHEGINYIFYESEILKASLFLTIIPFNI